MKKQGARPKRPTSRYPAEVRAHMIAQTVRDLQVKYINEGDTAHLVSLVVHGHELRTRQVLEIARPHMDSETVAEIFREALADFNDWGSAPREQSDLVNGFSEGIMGALQNIRKTDRSFGETAFLCAHPSGAACLSYFSDQGRDVHFMRQMVFDALQMRYEKRS